MTQRNAIALLAAAVLVLALLSIVRSLREPGVRDATAEQAAGTRVSAERTADYLGGSAEIVLVTAGEVGGRAGKRQSEIFQSELEKRGIEVRSVEELGEDEYRHMEEALAHLGLPPEWFIRLMERWGDVDAVVSLAGLPFMLEPRLDQLPEASPQLVVAAGMGPDPEPVKGLLRAGVLHMAIVPRPVSRDPAGAQASPEAKFDAHYEVVTAGD
jgi:hypothetical protein